EGKEAERTRTNDPKTATTDPGSAVSDRCDRINGDQMTTINFAACECLYESQKQAISFSTTYKAYRIYVLPSKSYVVVKAYFTGGDSECPWRLEPIPQFAYQDAYVG